MTDTTPPQASTSHETRTKDSSIKNKTFAGDNSEKVHFRESGAYKYMTGVRRSTGIRVDKGLYSRFKKVSKAIYGSTCRALELYMIALIETAENGVHFSNITNQPIKIEAINIYRNLRPRRALPAQDFEVENWKREKRQKERQNELEALEKTYRGVLEQFETLKPHSQRHHLQEAEKIADCVPSAKMLLERFAHKKETSKPCQ